MFNQRSASANAIGWRWIFFINIPIGLLSIFLTTRFVHDPPAFAEERKTVREDLFEAIAYEFVADIVGTPSYLDQTHNRSVICNAGVLMAGYATDDERLINYGLYG